MTWFHETVADASRQSLRIDRLLHRGRTAFQKVEIFDNALYGRVLALDGVLQTTERDEYIYHEMIAHVPCFGHGAVRTALIIGGGDGGTLEEVLKHEVEKVTMVELDREVVELCRRHLKSISGGAFDDPRLTLLIGDGARFVANSEQRYDVIIVDSTDPVGPATVLFERAFYQACRRRLRAGGILVTQNGCPFEQPEAARRAHRLLAELFPNAGLYLATVPSYGSGALAFGWASLGRDLARYRPATLRARYRAAGIDTRYYNPEVHAAAFVLPNDAAALLG